jgi:endonuclease/exonuclease/phosphatase family metal-dependent hydrolase
VTPDKITSHPARVKLLRLIDGYPGPDDGIRRWLRRGSVALAAGYLAGLLAAVAALRLGGERTWITTILLYLPRFGFALPLPVVALALLVCGPRRLLWGLPVALALLLFPLMGCKLGLGRLLAPAARAGGADGADVRRPMRVMTFNIATGQHPDELVDTVRAAAPDVLVVQEYNPQIEDTLRELDAIAGFHRHTADQFSIASRYPISGVYLPPKLDLAGSVPRSARFVRYVLATPGGPLTVINVHPVSPRNGLEEMRGDGLLHGLLRGRIGEQQGIAAMRANSRLRLVQAEAIAAEARRSPHPLLIAGDTNMPGLSWILGHALGDYRDAFAEVGRGFGYTFPTGRPWMRIDRILGDGRVAFHRCEVLHSAASDHLPVVADVSLR